MQKLSKDRPLDIVSSMSSSYHMLEGGCSKEIWFNYWNIKETWISDINNVKLYILMKFKDECWNENDIINKIKFGMRMIDFINCNLVDQTNFPTLWVIELTQKYPGMNEFIKIAIQSRLRMHTISFTCPIFNNITQLSWCYSLFFITSLFMKTIMISMLLFSMFKYTNVFHCVPLQSRSNTYIC